MTDTSQESISGQDDFKGRAGRVVTDLFSAFLGLAFIGLSILMAVVLSMFFLAFAGLGLVAFAGYWAWRKMRRNARPATGPEILVATKGPEGWTVEGVGPDGR